MVVFDGGVRWKHLPMMAMPISRIASSLSHCLIVPVQWQRNMHMRRLPARLTGTKMLSAPLVNFIHAPDRSSDCIALQWIAVEWSERPKSRQHRLKHFNKNLHSNGCSAAETEKQTQSERQAEPKPQNWFLAWLANSRPDPRLQLLWKCNMVVSYIFTFDLTDAVSRSRFSVRAAYTYTYVHSCVCTCTCRSWIAVPVLHSRSLSHVCACVCVCVSMVWYPSAGKRVTPEKPVLPQSERMPAQFQYVPPWIG